MPDPAPAARLDLSAGRFDDLTLAFDAFYRAPSEAGIAPLRGRQFLRCNLAGPALVSLGEGVRFTDCTFSACAFTALPDPRLPAPGTLLLEGCAFEDCVLTRWSVFVPPALTASLLRDMPHLRVFGLPPFV